MLPIIALVFIGVFAAVALPVVYVSLQTARKGKQVTAALDSALATQSTTIRDQIVNFRKDSQLSAIPWLNRQLMGLKLAPLLRNLLLQANVKWNAGKLITMSAVCFGIPAYVVYLRFNSSLEALGVGALLGLAPLGWVRHKRKQRFDKFQKQLPEALELMVGALRAGHSLIAAMGLVARECPDPVGGEFKTCFEEQNYGLDQKVAMDNLIDRVPIQELRIVATAMMIQTENGGNLAEVLDKASHGIRESLRLRRQVNVHTAQGRMTGIILSLLPLVLGIALYVVNPEMMNILWTRPLGIKLLWASGGLTVIGGLIIRKIVNMDV
jgi:tight adherence protein B